MSISIAASVIVIAPLRVRSAPRARRARFERFHAVRKDVEPSGSANDPAPEAGVDGGEGAGVYAGLGDRMGDQRHAGDDDVVGEREMPGKPHGATDHAALADDGA